MRILFFAQLKDLTGCGEVDWPETKTLTVEEVWERLEREWPGIASHRSVTRLAKNLEFVGDEARFQPEDEIALIPPVSGG